MTSYKDMGRTSVKRSHCDDDVMPSTPALESNSQEARPHEDGPALKPQPRKLLQSFKTFASSDSIDSSNFHLATLKRVVTDEDTTSLSEDAVKSEHDSKESSFELTLDDNSSVSEDGSEDSLCSDVTTTYRRTPRVSLRMRPRMTFKPSSHSTFYNDDASYQPQLLPREVSVDTLYHEDSVLMTPTLYQLSVSLLSPPPPPTTTTAQEIERKDDISITCIPNELCLPVLY